MAKKTVKRLTTTKLSKKPKSIWQLKVPRVILFALAFAIVGAVSLTVSMAAPSRCQPQPPMVQIHNTYSWASAGSWGKPGQKLAYGVQLYNYSCSSATLSTTLTAPAGFTVDQPTYSVNLRSRESKYFLMYVTSPTDAAVADYILTASVSAKAKNGTVTTGTSETNYYKVYTSDTAAPTAFWPSHANGSSVSGSVSLGNNFTDDHMARKIDLYIDGTLATSTTNSGVTVDTSLGYTWETSRIAKGLHTITWKAYDDFNNEAVDTWTLSVQ